MTYIIDLDDYELHPQNKKKSMTFIMNAKKFQFAYDSVN